MSKSFISRTKNCDVLPSSTCTSNLTKDPKHSLKIIILLSIITFTVSSKSVADTTSILSNYHYYNKFHRGVSHPAAASAASYRRELRTINSWNFRSLSSLQLSAQPPPSVSISPKRRSNGMPFGIENVASVSTSSIKTRRRRGGRFYHWNNRKNNDYDLGYNDILTNQSVSSRKRDLAVADGQGYDTADDAEYEPTLAEMRAQLGPIGLLIANAVEVGIATAGSYMSGGIFGYMIGGVMGVPTLFKGPLNNGQQPPLKPSSSFNMGGIQRRIGDWNSKAFAQGKSWASLSASFSGFHALTRVCRGGVEDKWNSIIGSACAGAYLSKEGKFHSFLYLTYEVLCITLKHSHFANVVLSLY